MSKYHAAAAPVKQSFVNFSIKVLTVPEQNFLLIHIQYLVLTYMKTLEPSPYLKLQKN